MPTPQPISEWIKILLTALVGMVTGIVGGLLLEPLKQQFTLKIMAKRAQKAIYREMSHVYHTAIRVAQVPSSPQPLLKLQTHVFDYYYERHREAFYEIPEWSSLMSLHGIILLTTKELREGDENHVRRVATEVKRQIELLLISGALEPTNQRLWSRIERTFARDVIKKHKLNVSPPSSDGGQGL